MIKLTIHKSSELDKNIKCTVHGNGKLGFSDSASKKLSLSQDKYMVIASNEEGNDENLYMWIENSDTNGGFKVCKAGSYYYLNTRLLFDKLRVNYKDKSKTIIYDIIDFEYEGNKIYKLIKREQKRTKRELKTDAVDN